MAEKQKYEFISIDRTLDFIRPLLVEGYKVEASTILKDSCVRQIDHYEITVTTVKE